MRVRTAQRADIATIVAWRRQTAAWLASQGSDQWSEAGLDDDEFLSRVTTSVEAGETWMAEHDGQAAGTTAIDRWADADLWTPDELADAMVIHRMIVPRELAGRRVGEVLLDHADRLALRNGVGWLRLDAWTTNFRLHDYYRGQGFKHVRDAPGKVSGALFERSVMSRVVKDGRTLASAVRYPPAPEPGPDPYGNPAPPDHWRVIKDLVIDRDMMRSGGQHAAEIGPDSAVRVRFDGRHWRYLAVWGIEHADRIIEWPPGLILDPAREYVLREIDDRAVIRPEPVVAGAS